MIICKSKNCYTLVPQIVLINVMYHFLFIYIKIMSTIFIYAYMPSPPLSLFTSDPLKDSFWLLIYIYISVK
jgi:hypothetical protein